MSLEFEWDREKAEANRATHGIDFEEALTIFRDPLAQIFDDEEHSEDEPREIIIGHSVKQRLDSGLFHSSRNKNSNNKRAQSNTP